jgi:hypothetical protein
LATSEELTKWAAAIRAWAAHSSDREAAQNLLQLADTLDELATRKRAPADDELIRQAMAWTC